MFASMNKSALILFRHGNTFEADQTPVWVGARTDMPLTPDGERQAFAAATYIEQRYDPVFEIVAGPLQRTCRFAEIIAEQARRPFTVDERLREIDYGDWEGLDGTTIRQRFGSEAFEPWDKRGEWPSGAGWQPPFDVLNASLAEFLSEQNRKLAAALAASPEGAFHVAVTSNGILRLMYTLITGKMCDNTMKVKTGHACVLVPDGDGWRIEAWNENPAEARLLPVS